MGLVVERLGHPRVDRAVVVDGGPWDLRANRLAEPFEEAFQLHFGKTQYRPFIIRAHPGLAHPCLAQRRVVWDREADVEEEAVHVVAAADLLRLRHEVVTVSGRDVERRPSPRQGRLVGERGTDHEAPV